MAYRWKSGIVLLFLHGHDLVFNPKTLALLSRKAARSGILLLMSLKNEEVSFQFFSFFFCFCCCCSFGVSALTGAGSWVHAILIRDPLNIPAHIPRGGALATRALYPRGPQDPHLAIALECILALSKFQAKQIENIEKIRRHSVLTHVVITCVTDGVANSW